jgi:hypothetical protein
MTEFWSILRARNSVQWISESIATERKIQGAGAMSCNMTENDDMERLKRMGERFRAELEKGDQGVVRELRGARER